MRYTRIIASVICATLILFSLIIPISAAATEQKIIIESCEASYRNQYFEVYYPQTNRDNYVFPQIKNPYNGEVDNPPQLSSITLLGYTDPYIDWKEGYIYTFNYTVAIALVQENVYPTISLGIATTTDTGNISQFVSVGDVTYTYSKNGTSSQGFTYTYSITSVVKVDSTFNNGNIEDYSNTYVALTIDGIFNQSSANVTVLANRMKVTKAIGEDAYYQASLDAIENLPQSEYDYIYNSMPDSEGEADVVIGDINEVYGQFNPFFNQITNLFQSDVAKPCVYLPKVEVPILNIKIFEPHVFYIDDYLNSMDSGIMEHIEVVVWFIRFVACVGFLYVGFYKITRIEWWT